ncbi:hypothetical protein [Streptomyces sp. SID8352]|uniref:hypothetical protein n=1 Tax=Streptomyces sp. SID8352 TaxID=2690338 RepID=UPI00136B116F|nr:hypothetical protein [Streptomyces sp. SID8352]MYU21069.1 hypothetical protein [Streptomyces sp. SID8352]
MPDAAPPEISVAVMCHPARREGVAELAAALRPLRPRLVWDPDPDAGPSPLRTAKLAWSAVAPGATHHLVLQDDVMPAPDFADRLAALVSLRDKDAIALYVNGNSPHNSYHVRRAAVAGSAWAPLAPAEWVPTLGLVLPAGAARGLGAHLRGYPDDFRDDDELVAEYCRAEGISVVAVVPHLLEHGTGPSIAGNDGHGHRRATVFAGRVRVPPERWAADSGPDSCPVRHVPLPCPYSYSYSYSVELVASRCGIRVLRGFAGEPVEHPFSWGWREWAPLVGADPRRISGSFRDRAEAGARGPRRHGEPGRPGVPGAPDRTRLEVWAAGYLLGLDAARAARPAAAVADAPFAAELRIEALRSWIDSGITERDASALGESGTEDLVRLCARAVESGARERNDGIGARSA